MSTPTVPVLASSDGFLVLVEGSRFPTRFSHSFSDRFFYMEAGCGCRVTPESWCASALISSIGWSSFSSPMGSSSSSSTIFRGFLASLIVFVLSITRQTPYMWVYPMTLPS